jgi:hypothetical protein
VNIQSRECEMPVTELGVFGREKTVGCLTYRQDCIRSQVRDPALKSKWLRKFAIIQV